MINYDIQLKAAAVQAEPVWFDADQTIEKAEGMIAEAASNGASIIAFPEIFISGYPWQLWVDDQLSGLEHIREYLENGMQIGDRRMRRVLDSARRHEINVVMGYVEIWGGSAYISQMFADQEGNLVGNRRKLKPTHVERGIFGDGSGADLQVWDSPVGRVGALNCWEHFQPLQRFTLAAMHEQIHVASWPSFTLGRPDGFFAGRSIVPNEATTMVHAIETGSFVLCSSQVIGDAGYEFFGRGDSKREALLSRGGGFARIFHPTGVSMADHLPEDAEGIVYADLDLNDLPAAKSFVDIVGQYSRPDIFNVEVNRQRTTWISERPESHTVYDVSITDETPQRPLLNYEPEPIDVGKHVN